MKIVYIFAVSFIFAGLSCAEGGVTRALDAIPGQGADDGNESLTKRIEPASDEDINWIYMGLHHLTDAIERGEGEGLNAFGGTTFLEYEWKSLKEKVAAVLPPNLGGGAEIFNEFKKIDTSITERLQAPVTTENYMELKRLFEDAKKLLNFGYVNLRKISDMERIYRSLYGLEKAIQVAKDFNADRGTKWLGRRWEFLKEKLPTVTPENVGTDIFDEFKNFDTRVTEQLQAPVTARNFNSLKDILEQAKKPLDDIVDIVRESELRGSKKP